MELGCGKSEIEPILRERLERHKVPFSNPLELLDAVLDSKNNSFSSSSSQYE